jgi:hypothetical protein
MPLGYAQDGICASYARSNRVLRRRRGWEIKINTKIKIRIKINTKIKGGGQECPPYITPKL